MKTSGRPSRARGAAGRRAFMARAGALVVAFAWPACGSTQPKPKPGPDKGSGAAPAAPSPADPGELDAWLAIDAEGRVTVQTGKVDVGMGIATAFAQIVAEELDVPVGAVRLVMGDTASTPDQGGTGSSDGIASGGLALRRAAAEARAVLLRLASARLSAPVDALEVNDGIVTARDGAAKVSYGALVGRRRLNARLTGNAPVKSPSTWRVAGTEVRRPDIEDRVAGRREYVTDLRLPGMLHARMIRPPVAGATVKTVESGRRIPGLLHVVSRGSNVAVICQREEEAVRVATALKVEWERPEPRFPESESALFRYLRGAAAKSSRSLEAGTPAVRGPAGVRTLSAEYEVPFHSHASMGPACAVADVDDTRASVWTASQRPHALRAAIAELLAMPVERVRVVWMPGPGSYGTNDADDAAADAALLSQIARKPVRVQYTRADSTGWDPKSPPAVIRLRASVDPRGAVSGWDYEARAYSWREQPEAPRTAGDTLAGQLLGMRPRGEDAYMLPADPYTFAHRRTVAHVIDWSRARGSGLRTGQMRDAEGYAATFATESFIDEIAAGVRQDPVAFRLRNVADPRAREVIETAARQAGWVARPSPAAQKGRGRGIAYAPCRGTHVAIVADVEADTTARRFRVTRLVCAHDCGSVVNPLQVRGAIEANLIQALSRSLHESVAFDSHGVRSVDWQSYPVIDVSECPDTVEIVLVGNTPERRATGAGEAATRPLAAAVANALFDATGIRVRRLPLLRNYAA